MKIFNRGEFIRGRRSYFFLALAIFSLILGAVLMAINLYGLTQPIRKPGLGITDHHQLRFIPKEVWDYSKSMDAIDKLSAVEQDSMLVEEASRIVNLSLIHINWNRVDPLEYRQLVPIWENYFLYMIGRYSGLPQYMRYHYADYQRNIRRGIGICGDASTVLSSILDRHGISNRIVSFRGHVIVEYTGTDRQSHLIDPDFGVSLGVNLKELIENPQMVKPRYIEAGYSKSDIDYLFKAYETKYKIFDDTYQFMRKRYLFERISYVMKWLLPVMLITVSVFYFNKSRRTRRYRSL